MSFKIGDTVKWKYAQKERHKQVSFVFCAIPDKFGGSYVAENFREAVASGDTWFGKEEDFYSAKALLTERI